MLGSLINRSPIVVPSPITRLNNAGSTPHSLQTFWAILTVAIAVNGVWLDGFQIVTSPQTAASALFHAHTATGKLKAVTIPTIPSGCHCSSMRCLGRSEAMVNPYNCRDRPTAKSQISIIS